MYYSSFGLLSLIITLFVNYSLLTPGTQAKQSPCGKNHKRFLCGVLVYYAVDILWGIFYHIRIIPLMYADTLLCFLAATLSVILWTKYVVEYINKNSIINTVLTFAGRGILAFEIIALFVNFFTPFVFVFDVYKSYYPTGARYIIFSAQTALFLATAVYSLIASFKSEGVQKQKRRAVFVAGSVLTMFMLFQTIFPFHPYYSIGCLIATGIIYASSAGQGRDTDIQKTFKIEMALADIKSKNEYEQKSETITDKIKSGFAADFAIAVFDLSAVKNISDYMTESYMIIHRHFSNSTVYNNGDDGLVIILESEDYNNMTEISRLFDKEIEKNQDSGNPLIIASGIAEYRSDEDADFKSVYERAEQKMYDRKRYLEENSQFIDFCIDD
ncbi:MAG: hypothetical protein J5659_05750 [Clostridia bacterium]|nr:hypothetical protein [Clostridia bacterium]